ncbi:hypothetical protein Q8A67_001296 [Cirrhinus molitorella]|uniref:Uncharacterized protein n=1 Tax=Cirrhinus molitorella TaxID=172907 RepID=A0AA88QE60_9TELE|nr:hypothetical protein Q8A67_001296 [Cirrhinus molitorella]
MEPISQTVTVSVSDAVYPRRPVRVTPRGASSHFVGSTIVILSSYAGRYGGLSEKCVQWLHTGETSSEWWNECGAISGGPVVVIPKIKHSSDRRPAAPAYETVCIIVSRSDRPRKREPADDMSENIHDSS